MLGDREVAAFVHAYEVQDSVNQEFVDMLQALAKRTDVMLKLLDNYGKQIEILTVLSAHMSSRIDRLEARLAELEQRD